MCQGPPNPRTGQVADANGAFSRKTQAVRLLVVLAVAGVIACRTEAAGSASGTGRVANLGESYSIDDLRASGVKVNKEYDVSELPLASSAWRVILDGKEYEARFYDSHEALLEHGAPHADEVTGDDALVNNGEATWQEGCRDRKFCTKYPNTQCSAKYGDYVIHGNMILMWEGLDTDLSIAACENLLSRLPAA